MNRREFDMNINRILSDINVGHSVYQIQDTIDKFWMQIIDSEKQVQRLAFESGYNEAWRHQSGD